MHPHIHIHTYKYTRSFSFSEDVALGKVKPPGGETEDADPLLVFVSFLFHC